jgi:hypothetical protein
MSYPTGRADRYRKAAEELLHLAESASSDFIRGYYKRTAERCLLMAQGEEAPLPKWATAAARSESSVPLSDEVITLRCPSRRCLRWTRPSLRCLTGRPRRFRTRPFCLAAKRIKRSRATPNRCRPTAGAPPTWYANWRVGSAASPRGRRTEFGRDARPRRRRDWFWKLHRIRDRVAHGSTAGDARRAAKAKAAEEARTMCSPPNVDRHLRCQSIPSGGSPAHKSSRSYQRFRQIA